MYSAESRDVTTYCSSHDVNGDGFGDVTGVRLVFVLERSLVLLLEMGLALLP